MRGRWHSARETPDPRKRTDPEGKNMNGDSTDPQAFFRNLTHDLGPKAKPEYLAYRPREVILEESAPVRRMLMVRHGSVIASSNGKHVCRYIADPANRYGNLPVLSATDYCYSS